MFRGEKVYFEIREKEATKANTGNLGPKEWVRFGWLENIGS